MMETTTPQPACPACNGDGYIEMGDRIGAYDRVEAYAIDCDCYKPRTNWSRAVSVATHWGDLERLASMLEEADNNLEDAANDWLAYELTCLQGR